MDTYKIRADKKVTRDDDVAHNRDEIGDAKHGGDNGETSNST